LREKELNANDNYNLLSLAKLIFILGIDLTKIVVYNVLSNMIAKLEGGEKFVRNQN